MKHFHFNLNTMLMLANDRLKYTNVVVAKLLNGMNSMQKYIAGSCRYL